MLEFGNNEPVRVAVVLAQGGSYDKRVALQTVGR